MAAGQAKRRASRAPAEDALEPSPTGAFGRHLRAATAASALFFGFWSSRPDWDPEMRLWRAFGDASLVLLAASLALGPLARLWPRLARLLPIRRELGIDFAVLASIHTLLVLNGWVRWDLLRFLGYEYIDAAGRWVRLESGFGLANIAGVVALVWALILAGTSSDRATRFLGPSAWKWLHSGAYTIFYLVTLHTAYFLFLHYTYSFHRPVPPPDWFRWPFLILAGAVVGLQAAAFAVTVRRRRDRG